MDVTTIWDRIESWYARHDILDYLLPGLNLEEVRGVEVACGYALPGDYRASLLRHAGSAEGFWPPATLLTPQYALSTDRMWREIVRKPELGAARDHDASGGTGRTQSGWWVTGWLPIDDDGAGNVHVLDTVPGPSGQVGQVLFMSHESGPEGPVHDSFTTYLRAIADDLDNGKYVWDEEDGLCTPELLQYFRQLRQGQPGR